MYYTNIMIFCNLTASRILVFFFFKMPPNESLCKNLNISRFQFVFIFSGFNRAYFREAILSCLYFGLIFRRAYIAFKYSLFTIKRAIIPFISSLKVLIPSVICINRLRLYPINTKLTSPNTFFFPRVNTQSNPQFPPICNRWFAL